MWHGAPGGGDARDLQRTPIYPGGISVSEVVRGIGTVDVQHNLNIYSRTDSRLEPTKWSKQ